MPLSWWDKMKTINFLMIITCLINLIFLVQPALALTANSSNYSVSMFGTGIATGKPSSINYNSTFLSEAKGTTRNAESGTYTANIGFFDDTIYYRSASITSYSISPSSAVVGSSISLSISALNVQSVWARIVAPNSQEQTKDLVNGQFVVYNPPSIVGRYNVTFYANSSSGAIASAVDYFELTSSPVTPPVQQPSGGGGSGGGGGTTTIIEQCVYFWDCTPWGLCADGNQTRECRNTGTCNGTESKPVEEMPCSKALFDIALNLKKINLTENNTLKFSVELVEKRGAEKIDVYVKYTIINKDNEEIFSQIETKAVQGNLSYQKEIEEIGLVDGEYALRVDIFYGYEQRAFAEQKFKIKDQEIKIEESSLKIQKTNMLILLGIAIITSAIAFFVVYLLIRFNKLLKRFNEQARRKRKAFTYGLVVLLIFVLLAIIPKTNIAGKTIGNLSSYNWKIILLLLLIFFVLALLIVLRKRIIGFLFRMTDNYKKHPKNSVKGLMNKKVYTESGYYIGKIDDVILGENRIESLKIKVDKKHKLKAKGVIIDYKHVKGVSELIIIEEKAAEHLEKFGLMST